ncbi:MAG TPA: peptidase, partial [Gemmatimonadetes bacterium]|nr:peptidase [Gemmatimonadota bacterium]
MRLITAMLFVGFLYAQPAPLTAQTANVPTISDRTAGMERIEGFFNLYWDASTGSLFWEISELDQEFLYQISMGSGLGSNPIGIDRGQLRGTHILRAQRVGPRILLVEPNYQYVARSPNQTEVQAVRDAFAPSVHWGFDVAAETDGRVLVDATQFFLRDARGVVDQIAARGQGNFSLDPSRSVIHM